MRNVLKSFYFCKKESQLAKKNFLFILSNCHRNGFFLKEFKWEIFTNCNFANQAMKTVHLALKFVLNKSESGW